LGHLFLKHRLLHAQYAKDGKLINSHVRNCNRQTSQANLIYHSDLMAPFSYPTFLLAINHSISLSKGTDITPYVVCSTRSIIHLLLQLLNLSVIVLERFADLLLLESCFHCYCQEHGTNMTDTWNSN
jgi:hypothetical protein